MSTTFPKPKSATRPLSSVLRILGIAAVVAVVAFASFYVAAYNSGYHFATNEVALGHQVLSCGEGGDDNSSCYHLSYLSANITDPRGERVAEMDMEFQSSQFPSSYPRVEESQLYFSSAIEGEGGLEVKSVDLQFQEYVLCVTCLNGQQFYFPPADCQFWSSLGSSFAQCPEVNMGSWADAFWWIGPSSFGLKEAYPGAGTTDFVLTWPGDIGISCSPPGCSESVAEPFNFTVTWTFTLSPENTGGDFFSPLTTYVGTLTIPFYASSNYTLSLGACMFNGTDTCE